MKRILSFLLFVLLAHFTYAQTSALRGTVSDKQSQYPLTGVTVVITSVNPPLGATTDADGRYRIENVPSGRHSIVVQYLGYEPQSFANVLLNSGKDFELNIFLQEKVTEMNAVEIVAEQKNGEQINKMSTVSTRSFSIEEAIRYSGTLQDPSRMAQNYAGVSGASDDRNDIIIRGNSPTGVLWRLEGIDIPSPNHFATLGTTGGPISMLNINNLANSDFATSAFAAEYGNALSGVFDLRMRSGNRDKREFTAQMGFNGLEFGLEGPFKKGGSATYMANFRYSFLDLLQGIGVNFGTGNAIPEYQDLTFKIDVPTKKSGRFTLFGMGGLSYINFDSAEASDDNLYAGESENSQFTSNTGVVGASHTYYFSEKTFGKLIIASSGTLNTGFIDTLNVNGDPFRNFGVNNRQDKHSAHYFINRKFNAKNTLKVGAMADYYVINVRDSSFVTDGVFFRNTDTDDALTLLRAYAQWQWRPNEAWTVNTGVHANYLELDGQTSIEPRIGARYAFHPKQSVSFGAGLHSQMQPLTVYFSRERNFVDGTVSGPTNTDLDFNKAIHTVLGYDVKAGENWRVRSEVYYQYLFNMAVDPFSSSFSIANTGADFTLPNNPNLVNEGTGENYGLELTVERSLNKGFYFLLTSSLFESTYKGSDGIERNTAFNGNYVFNLLAGKEWTLTKNTQLTADFRVTYAGGRRYSPINLEASRAQDREIRDESRAFEEQFTPYFRTDFKIGIRQNFKKFAHAFFFDVRNVTNQQNVFMYSYSRTTNDLRTTFQTGFFPIALYTVYF
jgi:hypothetical protein